MGKVCFILFISVLFLNFIQPVVTRLCVNESVSEHEVILDGFKKETESTKPTQHIVFSGRAHLLNSKQVKIEDFFYAVPGQYAYWTAKKREDFRGFETPNEYGDYREQSLILEDYISSHNPNTRCQKPGVYTGETVLLTLPQNMRWSNVEWIGMYCHGYKHLFNYMVIPNSDEVSRLDDLVYCGSAADCTMRYQECPKGADIEKWEDNAKKYCYVKCDENLPPMKGCTKNHPNANKPISASNATEPTTTTTTTTESPAGR